LAAGKPDTRQALLKAAVKLFGEAGFDATSTREIAREANANISAISYHFGGKDKLRLACAEYVAERLARVAARPQDQPQPRTPQQAAIALEKLVSNLVEALLSQPGAPELAQFVLREIARPGEVLDLVFPRFLAPAHQRACDLWALATGEGPESPAVRLAVFSILGQVVYFRLGQALVCKRMGWNEFGPEQIRAIEDSILGNLRVALATTSKGSEQ